MSKRADGEGTIYKRKDGRWRGRISLGCIRRRESVARGGDAQFVPHPSALTGTAYLYSSRSSLLSFRQSHGAITL